MARKEQMQIKGNAPMMGRPSSPEREKMRIMLEDIPEVAPGPNAFAIQAARVRRHRLEGNAFYQQEFQRRRATPPTAIHPAFRGRAVSDPPSPPRSSTCTTLSTFVDAGKDFSPELKLVPSPREDTMPTMRGLIEDKREHDNHERSGREEERVPVFYPTPKLNGADGFEQRPVTPGLGRENSEAQLPAKTPKRSLLSKLKLSTNSKPFGSPSMATLKSDGQMQNGDERIPVKVQAVLGASPTKAKGRVSLGASSSHIPRSPSKRKNFFSRKSDVSESTAAKTSLARQSADHQRPLNTPSTVSTEAPQTAVSDPMTYGYEEKRPVSKSHSEQGAEKAREGKKSAIARSQSLKYFDHCVPPTPPAKNTPPHEKAVKEEKCLQDTMKVPREYTSASDEQGVISTSDRLSPTKFGNYGYRNAPTLITKPSVYSMHASVVPDLMEASTIDEMNARVGALDLEGFSTPLENARGSRTASAIYTPSIYSVDWTAKTGNPGLGATPQLLQQDSRTSQAPSAHTKGSSSGGTIPVCYPDIASDPNMTMLSARNNVNDARAPRGRQHLAPELTWHGRTHSPDHLDSDRRSIFARHVENDDQQEKFYDSPSAFSHTSAIPSPLHTLPTLPPTVYTPPPKKSMRMVMDARADLFQSPLTHNSGLGILDNTTPSRDTTTRSPDIFDNKPTLPAQASTAPSTAGRKPSHNLIDLDPQKPSPGRDDKLDRMMDMLNHISARNAAFTDIRDEMRASAARLDQRLSAVETTRHGSPQPSLGSSGSQGESEYLARMAMRDVARVPTGVAHEFYRGAQQTVGLMDNTNGGGQGGGQVVGSDAMREMRETNRKLLEMVDGFAEKIRVLEQRVGQGPL